MMNRMSLACLMIVVLFTSVQAETVVDFEDLNGFNGQPPSGNGQYFNGYGAGASTGSFASQGVTFTTQEFGPGWSYSSANDTTTLGFQNQFAAFPGGGSAGNGTAAIGTHYAMVNTGSSVLMDGTPINGATLSFAQSVQLTSVDVANGTYGLFYLRDGLYTDFGGAAVFDPFAQFADGDFFRLRITGYDGADGVGNVTGLVDYDLANYGGAGSGDDFLLTGWDTIDLSKFFATRSLTFSTTSSQISTFAGFGSFSDVPAYAAIDNLRFVTAIPEPASFASLSMIGLMGLLRRRRKV